METGFILFALIMIIMLIRILHALIRIEKLKEKELKKQDILNMLMIYTTPNHMCGDFINDLIRECKKLQDINTTIY